MPTNDIQPVCERKWNCGTCGELLVSDKKHECGKRYCKIRTSIRWSLHSRWNMASNPNHFYVTLFSNASQKLYPANTLSAFTVHLAQPIDMGSTDRWEVGVCKCSCYPFNKARSLQYRLSTQPTSLSRFDIATVHGQSIRPVFKNFHTSLNIL